MIEVEGLARTFRTHVKEPGLRGSLQALVRRKWVEQKALKGVSFRVGEGEIVGLVGANGAGKTTLVKCLSGIIHPSAGEARVLGFRPWERRIAFRRQIALIMGQKAQLWWDLPAADCFLLLKEIYGIPGADFKKRVDRLGEALAVGRFLKTPIRKLSLGERMKVELMAALLHEPRVCFLDEPTIGLDLTAQRAIRAFLLEYRRERTPAMILTSHYMADIESLCERIIIVREGEFVYDGPIRRIIEDFSTHKLVRFQLRGGSTLEIPEDLATAEREGASLRLRVPKARVAEALAFVLSRADAEDVAVEEPEIGPVIEAIFRKEYL